MDAGVASRVRGALVAACLACLPCMCAACRPPTSDVGAPAPSAAPSAAASLAAAPSPHAGGRPEPQRFREMLAGAADQLPLDRVEEDPKRFPRGSAALADARDFVFVLGQGSAWHGFDTLRIEASGDAVLVFGGETSGAWQKATFRLSSEELEALKRVLVAIDVFGMKRAYFALADDGSQWFVRVRAGGQQKTVILDNHFPAPIVGLSDHVRTAIVGRHLAAIRAAAPLPLHGKLDEPMRWPEDAPHPTP